MKRSRVKQILAAALAATTMSVSTLSPLFVVGQPVNSKVAADRNTDKRSYSPIASKQAIDWANKQLRKMSIDEKIGQLVSIGINASYLNQDSEAFQAIRHQVVDNHVGGIILFRSPVYESVVLMNRMQELAKYPLLVSADLEAGPGMRFDDTINFPWNMAVGATGNPEYARRQGQLTARDARAMGIHHVFAPVVDVNNNAANPVINVRAYGEGPEDVGRFASAFVEGLQSELVIATAKHFPGHGDTAVDSHRGLPVIDVDAQRLGSVELVPFRAAMNAGVGSVMVAHIGLPRLDPTPIKPLPKERYEGAAYGDNGSEVIVDNATLPATLSPVIGKLLRDDLKFQGLIVTDAMDMSGLTIYFEPGEAAVRAVLAGADVLLKPGDPDAVVKGLKVAVASGRISEQRIEESARKVLASKYDLGLVKQKLTSIDAIDRIVSGRDANNLAEEIAEHAITLVRNDSGLVPFKASGRIVNLAITNGDDRFYVAQPFVSAMRKAGRRLETFVLDARSTEDEVKQALDRASKADVVIASLYGRVRTGQARSVSLPDSGAKALESLIKDNRPVVALSFGNPYLLKDFPALKTYLVAYGDMPSLQQAMAKALSGEIDIVGRLPISLPSLYPRGTGIQVKKSGPLQTNATN